MLNPNNWSFKEADELLRNLKCLLINMTANGGAVEKYMTEAQNYELTFGMPLPELIMAVENLVDDLRYKQAKVNPNVTTPFLFG
jgi:hypothetical protein